ncbi:MAG: TetR/AcrR family transcriptional regulator [Myxococcota bacterium]
MTAAQTRRSPKQERSQRRVEQILDATRGLVGRRGNDAVSMREIAAEAGVSVSSVYQYFPDKNALLRAIIERYLDEIRGEIMGVLATVRTFDDLIAAVAQLIDRLWAMFQREPELAAVWSGIQANATLRAFDMKDTRDIAEAFAALAGTLMPSADEDEVFDVALYIAHVAFFALRIAYHASDEDAASLLREQKRMIVLRLRSLVG